MVQLIGQTSHKILPNCKRAKNYHSPEIRGRESDKGEHPSLNITVYVHMVLLSVYNTHIQYGITVFFFKREPFSFPINF